MRVNAIGGRGQGLRPDARRALSPPLALLNRLEPYAHAGCITCGDSRALALRGIDGDPGVVKAETCEACRTYAKVLYEARAAGVDRCADDLASLALDLIGLGSRLVALRAKPAAAGSV